MIWALCAALGGSALCPLIHRAAGRRARWIVALLPAGLGAWLVSVAPSVSTAPLEWTRPWVPLIGLDLSLRLDGLGLLFASLIVGIGLLVVVHAGDYLKGRPDLGRFYAYLILFMAAMLGLVMADDLLLLFVFWELTSVSSYLLIGFEHERDAAREAARTSLLVTGLGGVALLGGVLLLGGAAGTYDLSLLVSRGVTWEHRPAAVASLALVLLGAFTKSAQVPFHFWLPRAMEAPTPVSAYLHSSTMVAAGVYLVARLQPVFGGLPAWPWALTGIGIVTAVVGALLAYRQTILKRLLAYSTVSALGIMMLSLGIGTSAGVKAALTFLVAHALYKSALFLSSANLTLATGSKDAEEASVSPSAMPITTAAALLGAAAMAGLPPTLGFIGKEVVFDGLWSAAPAGRALAAVTAVAAGLLVSVALVAGVRPYVRRSGIRAGGRETEAVDLGARLAPLVLGGLALWIGIAPGAVSTRLVEPAVAAVTGSPVSEGLRSWYGFNAAFFLDAGAVALGALAFAVRGAGRAALQHLGRLDRRGPEAAYRGALEGLSSLARVQTRWLQSGSLHHYVMIVVATAALLVGAALLPAGVDAAALVSGAGVRPEEALLVSTVAVAAVVALRMDSRLAVLAVLGVVGYGVALVFVLFGAPDLATTQILVETLTVILLALAFRHLPRFPIRRRSPWERLDAVLAVTFGLLAATLVLAVAGGDGAGLGDVSSFFARESVPSGRGRNIVNVILVDFRALDTLGEIVVVGIAAVGVYALLDERGGSP